MTHPIYENTRDVLTNELTPDERRQFRGQIREMLDDEGEGALFDRAYVHAAKMEAVNDDDREEHEEAAIAVMRAFMEEVRDHDEAKQAAEQWANDLREQRER